MFGMGFMEIFLILIVAIIALGPEKLPGAAVDIAKFFKKLKGTVDDAKSTLDSELNISEMKKEAEQFKSSVSNIKNISTLELEDITKIEDDVPPVKQEKEIVKETKIEDKPNNQDEFKVKRIKKEIQKKEVK